MTYCYLLKYLIIITILKISHAYNNAKVNIGRFEKLTQNINSIIT